jgi:tetratricopeptide (TPR) repeat protein
MTAFSRLPFALRLGTMLLVSGLFLAACESSEERAAKHHKSALELIEKGDLDRALVELRNVFRLDATNVAARRDFARTLRTMGRRDQAFAQYLRLAEQIPNDLEALTALSTLALDAQDWKTLRLYGPRLMTVAPDDPQSFLIDLNLRYLDAVEADDPVRRRAVAAEAQEKLTAQAAPEPDRLSLYRILVDAAVRDRDTPAALAALDQAITLDPENRVLWNTRLSLLIEAQRLDEVEALLKEMRTRFPTDDELTATLLRFYVVRGQPDRAEAFLREVIAVEADPARKQDLQAVLVRFLSDTKGRPAALAEVDALLAAMAPAADAATDAGTGLSAATLFRVVRAGLMFDEGARDVAIADMEALLQQATPSVETRRIKVALSRMLIAVDNPVGARRLVEEVLAEDATEVEALRMKAVWLIDEDKADEAIGLLRQALDQNSQDVQALTISAAAHARNGNRDLARDFLSLAVEASNAAPEPSLRYAAALLEDERLLPAEDVLVRALRQAPGNAELLTRLGQLYVQMKDWPRTEQVEQTLRRSGDPEQIRTADGLRAGRLIAQGRTADSITFLEGLATDNAGDASARIALMQARLTQGDVPGALNTAEDAVTALPDNVGLRLSLAAVRVISGDLTGAETIYRDALAADPALVRAWLELIRLKEMQGDSAAARTVLTDARAVLPEVPDFLWAEAGYQERDGNIEGAIAIYEDLYAKNPDSPIIANNLASLLSTWRDDPGSLDRAWTVARRLRGATVAPFQDTYGWIAYRRGQLDEALTHLEPAAAALAQDAVVQYHLGMVYAGLERPEDALRQLRKALDVAGPADTRPQIANARAEITRLEALIPPPVKP